MRIEKGAHIECNENCNNLDSTPHLLRLYGIFFESLKAPVAAIFGCLIIR